MSKEALYVSIDVLSMLAVSDAFDLRLLRLYLALCASSLQSGEAQEYVFVAQPKRVLDRIDWQPTYADENGWNYLDRQLSRLEAAGLVRRGVSEVEWDGAVPLMNAKERARMSKTSSSDHRLLVVLDPDGSPHRRKLPKNGKYVRLLQSEVTDICKLDDAELVLLLLLLSAVRLPVFGGVDQDVVSMASGNPSFGAALQEAYRESLRGSRYDGKTPIDRALMRLLYKGFFVWTDLTMVKVARYANKWSLSPSWSEVPRRGGAGTTTQTRPVLVPMKALGLHAPDVCFINGLFRGELSPEVPCAVVEALWGLVI